MADDFSKLLLISHNDLLIRFEVESLTKDMVNHVEKWSHEAKSEKLSKDLTILKSISKMLLRRIDHLDTERLNLAETIRSMKINAETVREKFVVEIGRTLRDNRNFVKLQEKVRTLEAILVKHPELSQTQSRIQSIEDHENKSIQPDYGKMAAADSNFRSLLGDLEETALLQVFSYLTTVEVLNAAQVNRFVFKRVDSIFGIESKLVKEAWGIRPECLGGSPQSAPTGLTTGCGTEMPPQPPAITSNMATPTPSNLPYATLPIDGAMGGGGLTREMADALSKKLTAPELKAIINLTDRLKRQTAQIQEDTTIKEDLSAKLQSAESVRDFLIEKLKSAEVALKAAFTEISTYKKQAAADQEVISFLDLRGQELEGINLDLTKKCARLQASYDLQCGSHSHTERHLQAELQELKLKLDEYETTYKTQKKLLVKEVKSLRAQVESISAERNRYRSQLQTLREALSVGLSPGGDLRDRAELGSQRSMQRQQSIASSSEHSLDTSHVSVGSGPMSHLAHPTRPKQQPLF